MRTHRPRRVAQRRRSRRTAGSAAGAPRTPSQKNCVSAVIDGASRRAHESAPSGRNFRMRNVWRPTTSPLASRVRRHPGDEVARARCASASPATPTRAPSSPTRRRPVGDSGRSRTRSSTRAFRRTPLRRAGRARRRAPPSTGEPPRSAMPVMRGVAIVQVCSISGGATISPKRDAPPRRDRCTRGSRPRTRPPSAGSSAGSPDRAPCVVPPSLMGRPTNACSRSSSVVSAIAPFVSFASRSVIVPRDRPAREPSGGRRRTGRYLPDSEAVEFRCPSLSTRIRSDAQTRRPAA